MYKDSVVLLATDVPDKRVRKVSICLFVASEACPAAAIIFLSDMWSIDRVDV